MKYPYTIVKQACNALGAQYMGEYWYCGAKPLYDEELGWHIVVGVARGAEPEVEDTYRGIPVRKGGCCV